MCHVRIRVHDSWWWCSHHVLLPSDMAIQAYVSTVYEVHTATQSANTTLSLNESWLYSASTCSLRVVQGLRHRRTSPWRDSSETRCWRCRQEDFRRVEKLSPGPHLHNRVSGHSEQRWWETRRSFSSFLRYIPPGLPEECLSEKPH